METPVEAEVRPHHTLDLAEIARVRRGDRVEVQRLHDSTQELFDRTIALVESESDGRGPGAPQAERSGVVGTRYVPENSDLRAIYLLAEAVGGYELFNDLVNDHSPGAALQRRFGNTARLRPLSDDELTKLREFQHQIHEALRNANGYLREFAASEFSREELHQLHEVILTASDRARELNAIIGTHLMHEVERAVERLHAIREKMRQVEQSIDGFFIVDSEVMFIPTNDLIHIVNTLFEAVGNTHLARHVDGVLLLAARNLLIEVVSFHSYYGKQQIYHVLKRSSAAVSSQLVTQRIRYEIGKLFEACKRDNKLVLTRVMDDAQREFELSVEAIRQEAEESAFEAVRPFLPVDPIPVEMPRKQSLLTRLLGWLGGR